MPRIVNVSSGGMYTERLKTDDLNFERLQPFDGTRAYAQTKVQPQSDVVYSFGVYLYTSILIYFNAHNT